MTDVDGDGGHMLEFDVEGAYIAAKYGKWELRALSMEVIVRSWWTSCGPWSWMMVSSRAGWHGVEDDLGGVHGPARGGPSGEDRTGGRVDDRMGMLETIPEIEDEAGTEHLDAISEESDDVMVKRGDLGVEVAILPDTDARRSVRAPSGRTWAS